MMKLVRLKPLKMPKKNAVKAKDVIKPTPVSTAPKPMKIHGHTTIILTDKDGNESMVEDDNMQTNALEEYFRNCGFMNYPNANLSELVPQLLGGIMGLDTALSEDATVITVPAGVEMVFNGSILSSSVDPNALELGQYVESQSGWQDDGSYVETYDYSMEQGNCKHGKSIACVCLTGREYGLAGEGNSKSLGVRSSKVGITNLQGTMTSFGGYAGTIFGHDLENSICYGLDLSSRTEGTLTLRKYNIPVSNLNLKGTTSVPFCYEETEIDISSDTDLKNASVEILTQACAGKCLIWDMPIRTDSGYGPNKYWGSSFTQHLWTVEADGTITKETVLNTTGVSEIQGLGAAYFLSDKWCIFPKTVTAPSPNYAYWQQKTTTEYLYVWDRENDTMVEIENPYGSMAVNLSAMYQDSRIDYRNNMATQGKWQLLRSVDGKAHIVGADQATAYVVDCVNQTLYPTNANFGYIGDRYPISGLVEQYGRGVNLYRDQGYIATINNLATPVVKDNTRTMRVIYRLTFEEEEEE